jgi:hypothetical protein
MICWILVKSRNVASEARDHRGQALVFGRPANALVTDGSPFILINLQRSDRASIASGHDETQ